MAGALVLNVTLEPLSVVSTRRALVLVLRDRADVLATNGAIWRSEELELSSPSVVRLRRYIRVPYDRKIPLNRRSVFVRDRHECQYCGTRAENLDHVVPKSQGGMHTWENVVASCRRCNTRKGGRTPDQAGLALRVAPRRPIRTAWVTGALDGAPDPTWEPYLSRSAR
jgi:5-methylcytosine-specific restriction endonuclease McrA